MLRLSFEYVENPTGAFLINLYGPKLILEIYSDEQIKEFAIICADLMLDGERLPVFIGAFIPSALERSHRYLHGWGRYLINEALDACYDPFITRFWGRNLRRLYRRQISCRV